MGLQQPGGVGRIARQQRAQDCAMFLVGLADAVGQGEIQPPHDANAFGGGAVHARYLGVARRGHQVDVKAFIQVGQPLAVAGTFAVVHQPDVRQRMQRTQGVRHLAWCAQRVHGRDFQHAAQLIEVVQRIEVQRLDQPAIALPHLKIAFAFQPEQRFAHGRAADLQAVRDLGFREAVARGKPEIQDVPFQRPVGRVGQRARHVDGGESGFHSVALKGNRERGGSGRTDPGHAGLLQRVGGAKTVGFAPGGADQLHA
ncbi:hypothetical protein G6F35_014712 [Rhizopus arrhizus]|nr:hypothetical protein G6F35_014712 [Rhizopus arrhizus]